MNRTVESLLAIVLILGIGLPAWRVFLAGAPPAPAAPPIDLGPVPVLTRTLQPADLPLEVTVYGTLEPRQSVVVASELAGRLIRVHPGWETGARVAAGEELLALDAVPFELARDRAQAAVAEAAAAVSAAQTLRAGAEADLVSATERVEIAERELERRKALIAEGDVSASEVDRAASAAVDVRGALVRVESASASAAQDELSARTRQATAAAALAEAQDLIRRSSVIAAFDGRFAGRAPALGAYVQPGLALGEIVDTDVLILMATVPEDQLSSLEVGQWVSVELVGRFEVERNEPLEAVVTAVGPRIDGGLRAGRIEVELENNAEHQLAAGLFAEARVGVGKLRGALVVGRREFQWREGSPIAYALVDREGESVCEARQLKLDRAYGEGFVVIGGLEAGEVLITGPLDPLRDGRPCRLRQDEEAGGAFSGAGDKR